MVGLHIMSSGVFRLQMRMYYTSLKIATMEGKPRPSQHIVLLELIKYKCGIC